MRIKALTLRNSTKGLDSRDEENLSRDKSKFNVGSKADALRNRQTFVMK